MRGSEIGVVRRQLASAGEAAVPAMRENHAVRVSAPTLFMVVAGGTAAIAIAVALLRKDRLRVFAWLVFFAGVGSLSLLVLMQLTARLGPEHLWFRASTFYIAAAVLAWAGVWWLRRPTHPALRFGLPAAAFVCIAIVAVVARLDGRSAPLTLLLPTLGERAPELSYFDTQGEKQTLADLRGRVVLINFWATWCTPCRREMPMLSKLQREHAEQGLVVLFVSLEEPDVLTPFLAANRFDGVQGRLAHAADYYDAGKIYPLSYLISRDGRVAQRWSGRPREDWLTAQIAAQL
jgi:thiol-disulfide isomerase/thioredoxin